MKVEYTPGEGDVQEFSFVPDDVPQSQAEMVEKRYGKSWDDFLQDVRGGNAKARKVLLWHLLRQTHHTLRFEDTPDFKMGSVKVSFDVEELSVIRERVLKANLSEEDREAVLTALDIDLTEAMGEPAGKAEADPGPTSTTSDVSVSDPIA
jgi:hypothetical protein